MRDQYNWQIDIHDLLKAKFDAIVVTDMAQKIEWVSKGFESMTGYKAEEAIGKNPSFLQGPDTNIEIKKHVRQHLDKRLPVEGILTNYKKNGLSYLCSISIMPIFDNENRATHFIALEKNTIKTVSF